MSTRHISSLLRFSAGAALALTLAAPAAQATDTLERVKTWAGQQVLGSGAERPDLTPDGRYAVYQSGDWNLFFGFNLTKTNVIFRDLQTGTSELISKTPVGGESNGISNEASLSPDGRFVVFSSSSSDIVPGSPSGVHIYVYDRQTGVSDLVDVASGGAVANASSNWPSISDDGRYVAFQSGATNLAGADLNVYRDVFVRDRQLGITTRLSNGNFESETPDISGDGQRVVFHTRANNILANDTNGLQDVVLWNMSSGLYQLVSHNGAGGVSNGISWISTISQDGRWVAFCSSSTNLPGAGAGNGQLQVILWDSTTDLMSKVSVDSAGAMGDKHAYDPRLSSDGRFVTFRSRSTNLIASDTNANDDIFVHDTESALTRRVSESLAGVGGNFAVFPFAPITTDGTLMLFVDQSNNLVSNDTNGKDLFLRTMDWPSAWANLGSGLAGTNGVPVLKGSGDLSANSAYAVTLSNGLPLGTTNLVVGFSQVNVPFKGGVLVPNPDLVLYGLPLDASGGLVLAGTWPAGIPSGVVFFLQHWMADGGAVLNWAASNGLSGTTP